MEGEVLSSQPPQSPAGKGAAAPSGLSDHLQPQLSQRLTIGLQLAALQQLLLSQQPRSSS